MKIKLFVALETELPKELIPEGVEVFYTGVGKINAAIKATEILSPTYQVYNTNTMVLNYGSAGSKSTPTHSLVECKVFYQEDMDGRPFAPQKTTPFDKEMYPQIGDEPIVFGAGGRICHTQDHFEQNPKNGIFDMNFYKRCTVSINGSAIGKTDDLSSIVRSFAEEELKKVCSSLNVIPSERIRYEDNITNNIYSNNGFQYNFTISDNAEMTPVTI